MHTVIGLVIALLATSALFAGTVAVEIVDSPRTVWTYGRAFLTVALTNHDSNGILVPVNRLVVDIGVDGQGLERRSLESGWTGTDQVVWIEPGARWLVRLDISHLLLAPSDYQAQVCLASPGQCRVDCALRNTIPMQPVGKGHLSDFIFDCWSGLSCSEAVTIASEPPAGDMDTAALEWLHSRVNHEFDERVLNYILYMGYSALEQRFPESHYTYVASLGTAVGSGPETIGKLERLLSTQPSHPLTAETLLYLALVKLQQGIPISLQDEKARLPSALAAYLDQESRPKPTVDRAPCGEFDYGAEQEAAP